MMSATHFSGPLVVGDEVAGSTYTVLGDAASNEILTVTPATSPVNQINLASAATSSNPAISATGDDTNISLQLTAKGTGVVLVGSKSTGTEAANSVTVNAQTGVITTSSLTTASTTVYSFDLVNSKLTAKDQALLLTISGGGNSGGRPFVFVDKMDAVGSAKISIGNAGVTALNGTVVISFLVL